jgi:hypothetical protein
MSSGNDFMSARPCVSVESQRHAGGLRHSRIPRHDMEQGRAAALGGIVLVVQPGMSEDFLWILYRFHQHGIKSRHDLLCLWHFQCEIA